jgi:phage protein D
VVEDVLSAYDFTTVEVEDADVRRDRLVQHAQTDYGFLDDLASTYGHSFHARRKTARFVPERALGSSGSPDATLTYGEGLARFSAESSPPPTSVELRAWNPETAAVDVVAESGSGGGSAGGVSQRTGSQTRAVTVPNMPKREAKRIAAAHSGSGSVVTGSGQADGDPAVQAGATVRVEGVGERFSGPYLVTSATHRLGGDGYGTTFQCREVSA